MPDDTEFSDHAKGLWTFSEAICWIKWRSPEMLEEYRRSLATDGRHPGYMRFLYWCLEHNHENEDIFTYTRTEMNSLFRELALGALTATARIQGIARSREVIPAHEFADLSLDETDTRDVLRFVVRADGANPAAGQVAYVEPRLFTDAVRERWKPKSKRDRQHDLTSLAFNRIGFAELGAMSQKNRENRVIECVSALSLGEISVSPRFVRDRWREARKKK